MSTRFISPLFRRSRERIFSWTLISVCLATISVTSAAIGRNTGQSGGTLNQVSFFQDYLLSFLNPDFFLLSHNFNEFGVAYLKYHRQFQRICE